MNVSLHSPPLWVDDQESIERTCASLMQSNQIGVDTESNSLYAYREQVCLLQLSNKQGDFLIDPLAKVDLSPCAQIFASPIIEKIFHAAEYDILCLKRDFGFEFNHLFDTMHAARILGMEKLNLPSLLSELLGVERERNFQKANWGKRPLSKEMLHYARLDTHYLIELRDLLEHRLEQKDLLDLAREDFLRISRIEPAKRNSPLYAQVSGYHLLDPQSLAILDELCKFRDRMAQVLNRPHFKVISSSALLAIAEAQPMTTNELKNIKGVSSKIAERYGRDLIEAVKKGANKPPIVLEKRSRPSQDYLDRLQALQNWRKNTAKQMGVQSDIVLPREILDDIAAKHPKNKEELQCIMAEVPWRYERFGHDIIRIVEKR